MAAENAGVKLMKAHRVKAGGKTYQYLRGEYHRHTEISWDGSPDGSLEDMFRYAIDVAQMDWIGNGDHDNGAGREYPWWLTQKFTDAYHAKAFTPMFTYERSVAYPHGHRNVMFAQRGVMTLPRLTPPPGEPPPLEEGKKKGAWPGGVHPDDAKMLYRYLHEFDGICASTPAPPAWAPTGATTIPSSSRSSKSIRATACPTRWKAPHAPATNQSPARSPPISPAGIPRVSSISRCKKAYKLGFQASSDHWSTHISFFIILAEGRDRQSLLKAVKERHCYGATDNILVDFRCGDKIMGDVVATARRPNSRFTSSGPIRSPRSICCATAK